MISWSWGVVLRAVRHAGGGACGAAVGGIEPGDLGVELAGFFLQGQNAADAGEVESIAGEGGDLQQAGDVVLAVAAGAAGAASGVEQAFALVDPQGLRMQAGKLGGYRDAVQALGRVGFPSGVHHRRPRGPASSRSRIQARSP